MLLIPALSIVIFSICIIHTIKLIYTGKYFENYIYCYYFIKNLSFINHADKLPIFMSANNFVGSVILIYSTSIIYKASNIYILTATYILSQILICYAIKCQEYNIYIEKK